MADLPFISHEGSDALLQSLQRFRCRSRSLGRTFWDADRRQTVALSTLSSLSALADWTVRVEKVECSCSGLNILTAMPAAEAAEAAPVPISSALSRHYACVRTMTASP
jgi:hypothetical protein